MLDQGMIIPLDIESKISVDSSFVSLAKESKHGRVWVVEEREDYRRGDVRPSASCTPLHVIWICSQWAIARSELTRLLQ